MTDIVDEIDALVDAQLAGGPVDDYNADRYDKCPHCDRHWHGLPVTQLIAAMYRTGQFIEDYSCDADDTRILCRGSDFIGPMPSEHTEHALWSIAVGHHLFSDRAVVAALDAFNASIELVGLGWHYVGNIREDDAPAQYHAPNLGLIEDRPIYASFGGQVIRGNVINEEAM